MSRKTQRRYQANASLMAKRHKPCQHAGCWNDGKPVYLSAASADPSGRYCDEHRAPNGYCYECCIAVADPAGRFTDGPGKGFCDSCWESFGYHASDYADPDDWPEDEYEDESENNMDLSPSYRAAEMAAGWLARDPLFADCETTGLDSYSEICEIAILSAAGDVLFASYVKPVRSISAEARLIHGISNQDVASAPTYGEIAPKLAALLSGRLVIAYNAAFDTRMLRQSLAADSKAFLDAPAGLLEPGAEDSLTDARNEIARAHESSLAGWACAMTLYSEYAEVRRWQKLTSALSQCGLAYPSGQAHRAIEDAEALRQLVRHMARIARPDHG